MAEAIKPVYYAELNDPYKGMNGINIYNLFNLILDRYCNIGQTVIDDNITCFNESINPSLPLAVYFRKQDKWQDFAKDANVPISEDTMVTTWTKHSLQYGNLVPVWSECRQTSANQQTRQQRKLHCTAAFNEQWDI